MFEIILLRHGKSPALEESGVHSDAQRPLAEKGRVQAGAAGRALRKMELIPDVILTSPLARARETADLAGKELGRMVPVEAVKCLSPGAASENILDLLKGLKRAQRILLVGHQPDLGGFASYLISGRESSLIAIKPGGMLLVEMEGLRTGTPGALRWLMTHDIIKDF